MPPNKKLLQKIGMRVAVSSSLISEAWKVIKLIREKDGRLCPSCGYKVLVPIVKIKRKPPEDSIKKKSYMIYIRCSGCASQYKSLDHGPLLTPSDEEWGKYVKQKFKRKHQWSKDSSFLD